MEPVIQSFLAGFPTLLLHFSVTVAMLAGALTIYQWITPYHELPLIRAGNMAAAISFAGAIVGLALPLAVCMATSVSVWDIVLWGIVALLIQLLTFRVIDALLKDNDLKALAAVARAMHEIINLPREAVAGVAVPVLGISGEHDPERGNLERMAGVVPNFTMKVLDGVDHMGAVADPRLGTYIREFLLERVAR